MKSLQWYLQNPNTRFKTMSEMTQDYGVAWSGMYPNLGAVMAMEFLLIYGGKLFYPAQVINGVFTHKEIFMYGPLKLTGHMNMLTTRMSPKFDSKGQEIHVGNIVRINYPMVDFSRQNLVHSQLRNTPGTLVRVLKVNNPSEYLSSHSGLIHSRIDKFGIAVELLEPASSGFIADIVEKNFEVFKKKGFYCAFEIFYNVTLTTPLERKTYYTKSRG